MAWTANVTNVTKQIDVLLVTIQYTDGVKTHEEIHKLYNEPDAEWLERTADGTLKKLSALENTTIPTGTITNPTAPDLDKVTFIQNVRKLSRVMLLVDAGVLLLTDTDVVTLTTSIKNNINKYWNIL